MGQSSKFIRKWVCPSILLLSLSSCSSWSSTLSKVKIQKEIELKEKTDQALATNDFRKGYWPEEKWWEMFEDQQLSSFIQIGIDTNPSLKAAEARVKQANQEAFVTRAKLFPQIQGFFNYLYTFLGRKGLPAALKSFNPNYNLFALMLDFTYEFDFWRKNMNAYQAALGAARTQEAINQQTKMILSVSIAKQYYDLQANCTRMAILQEILENKTKLFRLIELRRENRIDNLIDINNVKQEILSLQEALAGLAGELKLQKNLLITLMGKNPAEEIKIMTIWDLPNKTFELPDSIGLDLLARRPDLMAQVWTVYSMTRQVGVAVAQFLPNVNLAAVGGTDAMSFSDLFSSKAWSTGVLPYLTFPVFLGGKLRGQLKAQLAAYEAAVYDYNSLLLNAANEVVSGITKINTASEKLGYQNDEVGSKKDNYNLVYSRYKHGIDSMIKVLMSDYDFLQSRYQQVDLSSERVQASIDLVRALGGGYHYQQAENNKEIKKL